MVNALTVAAAATSMPTTPVILLVGGLVVLAAGLLLLTGGRDRTVRPTVVRPAPSSPPRPAEPVHAAHEGCDWSLWLEDDRGARRLLRTPDGADCCTYVLRVRDLDPVGPPTDETTESLVWQGRATRVGADAATTVLERDRVTRQVDAGVGSVVAALSLDLAPGPSVATTRPPDVPDPGQLWQRHLDDLHDRGARPVPTDGARVEPVVHQRRVAVDLVVDRACDVVARRGRAEVACAIELASSRRGAVVPVAPALVGWVELGASRVAAVRPAGEAADGRWDAHRRVPVAPDRVAMVVGTTVALELHVDGDLVAPASAEVRARATAGAHLTLGPDTAAAAPGCIRCVPDLELLAGRPATPGGGEGEDERTAGSTPEVTIRFDGTSIRLRPPRPGSGARSWTAATEDVAGQVAQPVTS